METLAHPVRVDRRPLVRLLYVLLKSGGPLTPERLEQTLTDIGDIPPVVRDRYDLPDLARYAIDAADRLDQLAA